MEVGESKPPYTAGDLRPRWELRSPAGRWEVVTMVDHTTDEYMSRIFTDKTRAPHGWYLPKGRSVHAIPPRTTPGLTVIRLVDHGASAGMPARMLLIIAAPDARFAWDDWEDLPAYAEHLGRGKGWQLVYRPNVVGELVHEHYDDKMRAKRRMNAIAAQYAIGLDMKVGDEMGRD